MAFTNTTLSSSLLYLLNFSLSSFSKSITNLAPNSYFILTLVSQPLLLPSLSLTLLFFLQLYLLHFFSSTFYTTILFTITLFFQPLLPSPSFPLIQLFSATCTFPFPLLHFTLSPDPFLLGLLTTSTSSIFSSYTTLSFTFLNSLHSRFLFLFFFYLFLCVNLLLFFPSHPPFNLLLPPIFSSLHNPSFHLPPGTTSPTTSVINCSPWHIQLPLP